MPEEKIVLRCPYCGADGVLRPGDFIRPGKGWPPHFVCLNWPRCDSYVRCHQDTLRPMGTLASKQLRKMRSTAHELFDPIWRDFGSELGRTAAYEAARRVMEMETGEEFHIGLLDEAKCEKFIDCIQLVEIEMDRMLEQHMALGAPPSEVTIEVLHALFHPDRDTFHTEVPLSSLSAYESTMTEAKRSGLIIQNELMIRLSPKGTSLVFDPTN